MDLRKGTLLGFFWRFAERLRFPQLFALAASLFVIDLVIPDLLPFADEILLGLATLLLGSWRRRRVSGEDGPDKGEDETVIDI